MNCWVFFLSREIALVPGCSAESQILPTLHHHCCIPFMSSAVRQASLQGLQKTKQNPPKPHHPQKNIKTKKNHNPNKNPTKTLFFTSKPRADFGHWCIPDVPLPFYFEVYMLQYSGFFPSGRLNCNELLGVFAPLLACLNRRHWIDTNLLFWLQDLLETPVPASLWKATWPRSHQAAQSAVQMVLRAQTWYKNFLSKSKHAPSSCP